MISTLRSCDQGHQYYKTSDCPTCPVCESLNKPDTGMLSLLSAPARRALQRESITTLKDLSKRNKSELIKLHGFGPKAIGILENALRKAGLAFVD